MKSKGVRAVETDGARMECSSQLDQPSDKDGGDVRRDQPTDQGG